MNSFEDAARSFREIANTAASMERPMLLASQSFIQKGGGRRFKCAKCKRSFPPYLKAIAPRRSGGPGIVSWCLGCVCSRVSSWEHPWHSAE